jgi:Mrp family chromosome partitioning ATPase
MSKNFELLRNVGIVDELFVQGPPNGDRSIQSKDEVVRTKLVSERRISSSRQEINGIAKDEIVKLVGRVFVFSNSHPPRTVCFSSVEGNGSGEICLHTGESLAKQGVGSVCLVETNLHAHSIHRILQLDTSPGLSDALINSRPIGDYTVSIGRDNLRLLPPGSSASATQDLCAPDRLRARIMELKEQFAFVLVDAPALNSQADPAVLGNLTDGLILVLEANSTRRETARRAKQNLERANVRILGAILNNRTFPIPEALYRRL